MKLPIIFHCMKITSAGNDPATTVCGTVAHPQDEPRLTQVEFEVLEILLEFFSLCGILEKLNWQRYISYCSDCWRHRG